MHEGHRQRMYEKLEKGDNLFDHEVLEILLYSVCPRINTNPLAHKLLDRFVSLYEIFNADVEELKEVEGVGDTVARFLKTVGLSAERIGRIGNSPSLKNFGDCKRFLKMRFYGKKTENIEIYFLDREFRVKRICVYSTAEKSRAAANLDSITKNIAVVHPNSIIIAHNHVEGTALPSEYDEEFTFAVQFICNMNGIQLSDHLIYRSDDEIFSYKDDGRLDKIKSFCGWKNFGKWIKSLNSTKAENNL